MLNIRIICVGKLKEKFWQEAVNEYKKRLSAYCKLTILQINDQKVGDGISPSEEDQIKDIEGKQILKNLKESNYVVCLEVKGEELTSPELSQKLDTLALRGKSQIDFIIGGSLGLSEEVLERADERISFSKLTFPHQMMRAILLEQIYRAFKISRNETYHK